MFNDKPGYEGTPGYPTRLCQPYTIKKGRYAFFVNCSGVPVRFSVEGDSPPVDYITVLNNKSYFLNLTEVSQDVTFLFSAVPAGP
jgi:hypothetical protein